MVPKKKDKKRILLESLIDKNQVIASVKNLVFAAPKLNLSVRDLFVQACADQFSNEVSQLNPNFVNYNVYSSVRNLVRFYEGTDLGDLSLLNFVDVFVLCQTKESLVRALTPYIND